MDVRSHHRRARRGRAPTRSPSGSSRTRGSRTTRRTARCGALVDSGEAQAAASASSPLTHADGKRWLVAGLGKRDEFDPERARVVAGGVVARARELGARSLCWELPHHVSDAHAAALRRGHACWRAYDFTTYQERRRRGRARRLAELIVSAHDDVAGPVETRPRRRRVGQPRPRPPEPPGQRPDADRAGRARARARREHDTLTRRGDGPRGDRGGRHGRVRGRRARHARRSRS